MDKTCEQKNILKKMEQKRTKPQTFTRTMGYYRNVESFNTGKTGEHKERKTFVEKGC